MKTSRFRAALSAVIAASMFAIVCWLTLCPGSARAQGGIPLWTNVYSGFSFSFDTAQKIAVDRDGNVFVTGKSSVSSTRSDFATIIKYSNTGQSVWTNRYNGPGEDYVGAIAVDGSGDAVVTLTSTPGGGGYDYLTIKYSSSGVPLWTNRYNGPANNNDVAHAIAVDSGGNVFVAGESFNSTSTSDFATIKYSSAGALLWTRRFGPGSFGFPMAIAVDSGSNVIVAGSSPTESPLDYATLKYSVDGVPLWTNRYNGRADHLDTAAALALDSSGNVFVTGSSFSGGTDWDYATIKYLNTGEPVWTNHYNRPGGREDLAQAIAVDGSGNVFVTGYSLGSDTQYDYATIKYSNAGAPLWTNRYSGPGIDHARAIALDSSGNVFVTGSGSSALVGTTLAYSNTGVPLWTNSFNNGEAYGVASDSGGNVFVTGYSGDDFVTIKYSTSLAPVPRLNFQLLNKQLVLSWTNAGYSLQTTPLLPGTFTNIPGATSAYTNPFLAPQQFFRLQSN